MSSYVSSRVRQAMYAVRGQVPTRAMKIQHEIENARASGQKNPHPFEKLIFCNIGNPQALGSPPLSFVRQVLSLLDYPTLLKSGETVRSLYPLDVLNRAEDMLSKMNFISGAYTDSMGFEFIRKDVATFLTTRDRVYNQAIEEADPSDIFLTDGASSGVKAVLQLVVGQSSDSVMIPVPQYPLYTATISLLGGHVTPYYLDESAGWSMNREVLSNAYRKSKEQGANPRLLVVINPGNPTGQVLTEAAIRDVIEFASENELMILADEVYQENIYCSDKKFRSFREILLSSSYKNLVPLFSVHSTSKGIIGECGRRGGYLEAINVHPEMKKELVKLMSINLCANVGGQLLVDLMVRPPQASHESYESYQKEYTTVANALRKKASRLYTQLNKIPGIRCNPIEGAMYAFPSLHLSDKYLEYHIKKNKSECTSIEPDTRWALELLEATGVVVVPGSGFGQLDGTFHFRTTILPQEEDLEYMTEKIKNFQFEHHQRYT